MLMKYHYLLLNFVTECGVHSPNSEDVSLLLFITCDENSSWKLNLYLTVLLVLVKGTQEPVPLYYPLNIASCVLCVEGNISFIITTLLVS